MRNSLEQFLINFANEKLQQYFNEYIFRMEEAACREEGVVCPSLQFADNSAVTALLEAKPAGLLSLINEEVLVPNSSDANLLQKMHQQHRAHTAFKLMPRAQGEGFVVVHFAGDVSYLIEGFVEKSRDALPAELALLLGKSELPLLATLFKSSTGSDSAEQPVGAAGARGRGARGRSGGGGRRVVAVGAQFKESLDSLMSMLHSTSPHFVRCVKPNTALAPGQFGGAYVLRQLQQMGMIHVVHARKQGYAHRYPFERFKARYGYLWKGLSARPAAALAPFFEKHLGTATPAESARKDCAELLGAMVNASLLDADGWAIGTGKIFLKAAQQQQLEIARESHLRRIVTEQLEQALATPSITGLEQALAAATEVRLQSPLLAQVRELLARLQAQEAAAAQLDEAVHARDATALQTALARAGQVGLAAERTAAARQLLSQLLSQQEAAAELANAMQRNETGLLAAALERATKTGLNTGLVQEAQRRLDGLHHAAELEEQLRKASVVGSAALHSQLQLLAQLLAQAEQISMASRDVTTAQQVHAALQDVAQLLMMLQEASAARDPQLLSELVARAGASTVQHLELQTAAQSARDLLKELTAERERAGEARRQAALPPREPEPPREAAGRPPPQVSQLPMEAPAVGQQTSLTREEERQLEQLEASVIAASLEEARAAASNGVEQEAWAAASERGGGVPCLPLSARLQTLKQGCSLIKVAEGAFARNRFAQKHVQLSMDARHLVWDGGKKGLELAQVLRLSVGLETRSLQKLYSTSGNAADVRPYHWVSLHTAARSFDFGLKDCGADENETLVLWVMTLQELLLASKGSADASAGQSAFSALSHAQQQWQYYASSAKEWPCLNCTFLNPGSAAHGGSLTCGTCGASRPEVTLCPSLMPLLPVMQALGNTLGVRAFEGLVDSHLQWWLLKALETPLPARFMWGVRSKPSCPDLPFLGLCLPDGTSFDTDHPHLIELRREAQSQLALLGQTDTPHAPATPDLFTAPDSPLTRTASVLSERPLLAGADERPPQPASTSTWSAPVPTHATDRLEAAIAASLSQAPPGINLADAEAASLEAAIAASMETATAVPPPPQAAPAVHSQRSTGSDVLDASDVFRHCMSGAVGEVRRFLQQGGHVDTVYKSAYGWDVGPEWLFTKPNDGSTPLNYVATWTDVIGSPAAELVALLLEHGADLERDDGLDQWFTPVHNAVANGAHDVVKVMLRMKPRAVQLTTGDGRTPLHVLALCDDATDRMATLELLLRHAADVAFAEPFEGNTPLHVFAREGFAEMVERLLGAGVPTTIANEARRTPRQEAEHALSQLALQPDPSATRRERIEYTLCLFEAFALSNE